MSLLLVSAACFLASLFGDRFLTRLDRQTREHYKRGFLAIGLTVLLSWIGMLAIESGQLMLFMFALPLDIVTLVVGIRELGSAEQNAPWRLKP